MLGNIFASNPFVEVQMLKVFTLRVETYIAQACLLMNFQKVLLLSVATKIHISWFGNYMEDHLLHGAGPIVLTITLLAIIIVTLIF
jgi:hypothetical protein